MFWYRAEVGVVRHWKTSKFARTLGVNIREAVGILHIFWGMVGEQFEDGDITNLDAEDLQIACGFPAEADGKADVLSILIDTGFIDKKLTSQGEKLHAHGWKERNSSALRARERMRKKRKQNENGSKTVLEQTENSSGYKQTNKQTVQTDQKTNYSERELDARIAAAEAPPETPEPKPISESALFIRDDWPVLVGNAGLKMSQARLQSNDDNARDPKMLELRELIDTWTVTFGEKKFHTRLTEELNGVAAGGKWFSLKALLQDIGRMKNTSGSKKSIGGNINDQDHSVAPEWEKNRG